MPTQTEYEQALELVEELNASAASLAKAQQKIRDPNVQIGDLQKILQADASITADVTVTVLITAIRIHPKISTRPLAA